ncbi:MAG TPA: hypothetical protein VL381_02570, partial [Rhodocyclaceae bacterium]|nr:hypothetical protein [Rhodocyclaceae bacterium]
MFQNTSRRDPSFAGVFEDGKKCRGFQVIGIEEKNKGPNPATSNRVRIKADTLTMVVSSTGDQSGNAFSPGGLSYTQCGGTYSFEPVAGKQYFVIVHDAEKSCGVSLLEARD